MKQDSFKGFTFIEVVVSLFIISVVIASFGPFLSRPLRQLASLTSDSMEAAGKIQFLILMESFTQQTQAPAWFPSSQVVTAGDSDWTVRFLQTQAEKTWKLENTSQGATISSGGLTGVYPGGRVEVVLKNQRFLGFKLIWTEGGGRNEKDWLLLSPGY